MGGEREENGRRGGRNHKGEICIQEAQINAELKNIKSWDLQLSAKTLNSRCKDSEGCPHYNGSTTPHGDGHVTINYKAK